MKARVVSSNVPLRMGNTSISPKKKPPMLSNIWKISMTTRTHLKQLLVFISRLLRLWILMNTRYVLFIFLSYMNMYQKSHNDLITIPSPKDHDQIKLTLSPPPGRGKTTPWSQIIQKAQANEPKVPIDFIMFSWYIHNLNHIENLYRRRLWETLKKIQRGGGLMIMKILV